MFEFEINGATYEFKFGMGFLRDINGRAERKLDGLGDETEKVGLQLAIAKVIDQDIEGLYDVLYAANKGFTPRLKQADFDAWIEDENTDVEGIFKQVEDFFARSNCCKIMYKKLTAQAEELA